MQDAMLETQASQLVETELAASKEAHVGSWCRTPTLDEPKYGNVKAPSTFEATSANVSADTDAAAVRRSRWKERMSEQTTPTLDNLERSNPIISTELFSQKSWSMAFVGVKVLNDVSH